MQSIIDDAKALEAEAVRGEEEAQENYESYVKETNESIEAKNTDITNKGSAKAKAEEDKVETDTTIESTLGEIDQLMNQNADLHKSCDYTLKNFEVRQGARDDEIEALKSALATFSGATFSAFLQ